jgi:hypothetical protein
VPVRLAPLPPLFHNSPGIRLQTDRPASLFNTEGLTDS